MSRESPSQKASHVLDTDLRNHWSTGTNTKEWILLELEEPCLLSHLKIYNKSVLEWEVSVGLRFKPETFVKVRPRCEAPRRDMMYPMNYTPCRYVRISCLRGNPIAIFYIQLIGIPVIGLEPEFQPVVNYLHPHIVSHKQDAQDLYLQLLQDITSRLVTYLPQLEADLNSFAEAAESSLRYLAMLAGPFYPILHLVNERETARLTGNVSDSEAFRSTQSVAALTVSSNFEPRRSRNTSSLLLSTSSCLVFRPDVMFKLLKKAYTDPNLGKVCRMASGILHKLTEPTAVQESSPPASNITSRMSDEASTYEPSGPSKHEHQGLGSFADYSSLFGEEFRLPDDRWDASYINVLDIASVEEGILHVLYASASQALFCSKLADKTSDFWSALPLVQALLPALRPNVSGPDQVDENFSLWKQPFVQHALSQIVATSSSSFYRPLLHACAGYLSSYSPSHAKAACILIDLCSGVLAPWLAQVIAKVDLVMELLEDLLGVIQDVRHSVTRARAALKFIVLALSGNMDDIMPKYKDVKHQILFLIEMLEPFLDPAITPKSMIAFGNLSSTYLEKQEHDCATALNVIRTAVRKSAVLPSLEAEWKRGSVTPSVLLSILEPHMQLPPDIDACKFMDQDGADQKAGNADAAGKIDVSDDAGLLFAPPELSAISLTNVSGSPDRKSAELGHCSVKTEVEHGNDVNINSQSNRIMGLDTGYVAGYSNWQADYLHLMNYRDCEMRASEFRRLALDLQSQSPLTPEGYDAAIDALLLAAECYINPYFIIAFRDISQVITKTNNRGSAVITVAEHGKILQNSDNSLKMVADLERKRDKIVLEILLEAADLDKKYKKMGFDEDMSASYAVGNEGTINLSQDDIISADAITLIRQNQALLCNFIVQQLQRDQHPMHEILMQSLLFLLQSATRLYCDPEHVVDIIFKSAEYFDGVLKSYYHQLKDGSLQLDRCKLNELQRRWMLLQSLVIASSGADVGSDTIHMKNRCKFANLIPPLVWLQKIPSFFCSSSPVVRFLGWMAVSRNAKQYQKERFFLASDLSQLTNLLSIFSDELALINMITKQTDPNMKTGELIIKQEFTNDLVAKHPGQNQKHEEKSLRAIYPEISHFFPSFKRQFEAFGETILEAVALQLRYFSSAAVPDLICWFSDLCSCPFILKDREQFSEQNRIGFFKGFVAKNAKAIILYMLEAIVTEHMEAMVPEVPRVVQVLVSLCRTPYCDVSFLESVLSLLQPIISYSLQKAYTEENLLVDDPCLNFESLCFDELFENLRHDVDDKHSSTEKGYCRALTIYVLAVVFPDLSFRRKIQAIESSLFWADFTAFDRTTFFHDYLCAYQSLMGRCKALLVETARTWGLIPLKTSAYAGNNFEPSSVEKSEQWFLSDVYQVSPPVEVPKNDQSYVGGAVAINQKVSQLTVDEITNFSRTFEVLISKLSQTIEPCCKVHPKLAKKLAIVCVECFIYSRCLFLISERVSISRGLEKESPSPADFLDQFPEFWSIGFEGLGELILVLQKSHCWEVASVMLDCLLAAPRHLCLDNVIGNVCLAIKDFSCSAPNITWRMQADKWLEVLLGRKVLNFRENEDSLVDMFQILLGHPEPEQRFIALKHLGKLVGQDFDTGLGLLSSTSIDNMASAECNSASELNLSAFVSGTWNQVTLLASSDSSLVLRMHAVALLVHYVPFADRGKLQSILAATDCVLQNLTELAEQMLDCPLTQISLVLIASICLYSPTEDVYLIPETVWRNIETIGTSIEKGPAGFVRKACQALCRLRSEDDEAKQVLKELLSSSSSKEVDPAFGSTRDSILQVIANLTSVGPYFDFFAEEIDHDVMELEEAEMEMELLEKEHGTQESSQDSNDWRQLPFLSSHVTEDKRLQQIKDRIRFLEKAKFREEVIERRQKKLLLQQVRKKAREEAALREAELLQELDRERTAEVEREIERQKLLELERSKTRELRHNLELEKEKQTQRELQRELEQVESGLRSARREFSSAAHSSRPRERYRERDNGRPNNEGGMRTNTGSLQPENVPSNSSSSPMPTVVLSGSRQFSGQIPTILQSRDRSDECGSNYEENFDGSRDSGDTSSVGDPDISSGFDGQSTGFVSGQRHGSRGSKSRQMAERRERDGRREGKWERKH